MFGDFNVAIMGCGRIAELMADTLKHTKKARLYAVGSRNLVRAETFAKKWGAKKAYGSYEELVADPKVQLIYVATPHSEHFENAKLCIEAGKPVLVEKSFTANAKQAEELIRLAEEKKVFLTEAMWVRYMPFIEKIKEVVDSQVVGTPVSLSANLHYAISEKKRMVDPALAGGALLDVGVYSLTFASILFGDNIDRIVASCSYTDRHVDEQDNIVLYYKDGRVANLTAGMTGVSDRKGIITCTNGFIIVENINNPESMAVYNNKYEKIASYLRPSQHSGYEYEVIASMEAIKNGQIECAQMPHAQTIEIMHQMDACRKQMGIVYPFEDQKNTDLDGVVSEVTPVEPAADFNPFLHVGEEKAEENSLEQTTALPSIEETVEENPEVTRDVSLEETTSEPTAEPSVESKAATRASAETAEGENTAEAAENAEEKTEESPVF